MLTTDLILTEKIGTKALRPRTAPLGFGSAFLNEREHPFPSPCSPSFSLRTWICPQLTLPLSRTHAAGIGTGRNDPSLRLRTKQEMLYNLQQKISFSAV